jgi:hypothetical protein
VTKCEALANFFQAWPDRWHDGETLAAYGGKYAWRTRVADLRRAPYLMQIDNRVRRVCDPNGKTLFKISEYRYTPAQEQRASA